MGQAQINVRTRACSGTFIVRTKQAALTHNVRGKELMHQKSPPVPVTSCSTDIYVIVWCVSKLLGLSAPSIPFQHPAGKHDH